MKYTRNKNIPIVTLLMLLLRCAAPGSDHRVTDIDGNVYPVITIGNKVWMAGNLRTTRYRNGDPIPHLSDSTAWRQATTGACCLYNNDTTPTAFGRLYNWYAITDKRNLAPAGWHIPTDEEINYLLTLVEKDPGIVTILKLNSLGGYRFYTGGSYHTRSFNGYWWSMNRSFEGYDYSSRLYTGFADVERNAYEASYGFSVRCVKD